MDLPTLLIVLVIVFAVAFDLTNGWNDAANAIATVISTRVLSPGVAVAFGAALNFVGALYSSEVAKTVGQEIADPKTLTMATFLAALIVAPVWITWCTLRGLPISCSHSLMGALVGSVIATAGGVGALKAKGIQKIVFGVFTSPVIGFLLGAAIIVLISWTLRRARPRVVNWIFSRLQIVSAGAMAFAHGTGDAQKAMGVITGALISGGLLGLGPGGEMQIPFWVRIVCASAMGLGTVIGGWTVIRTLGSRLTHLKPYQGFAAETAAATTILVNTLTGVPISTTHSITGAIMGVGAAQGAKAVQWGVGYKILFAWLCTFPACIAGGAVVFLALRALGLAG